MPADGAAEKVGQYLEYRLEQSNWAKDSDPLGRWVFAYRDALDRGDCVLQMALLHPDHYFDRRRSSIAKRLHPSHSRTSPTRRIPANMKCQSPRLFDGLRCPFPATQVDHVFPFALGGANVIENYINLCQTCNAMKSTSLLHYDWNNIPEWANLRLQQIESFKT